jgi:SAM-dependent methyltransferase
VLPGDTSEFRRSEVGQEPIDLYYTERDEDYLRLVREEAEFWDQHPEDVFPLRAPPKLQAYYNERFTGDPATEWYEVIPRHGEFRRGCALGCGSQRVERQILAQNPSLHLTFYDISGEALARRLRQFQSEFPGRVDTRQEDLNFALLPENAYDLIVSQSSMHHIVNLEHVAFQANRTLTAKGAFFLYDFVAESRLQFSDTKKRVYEAIAYATGPRRSAPYAFQWPDPANWVYSPFEAIRSGETLEVFRNYLEEVDLRVAGAIVPLIMFARLGPPNPPLGHLMLPRRLTSAYAKLRLALATARLRRRLFESQQMGDLLIIVDRIVSEAGCLKPALAFAVYRKRQR